jgi:hypothetical protein
MPFPPESSSSFPINFKRSRPREVLYFWVPFLFILSVSKYHPFQNVGKGLQKVLLFFFCEIVTFICEYFILFAKTSILFANQILNNNLTRTGLRKVSLRFSVEVSLFILSAYLRNISAYLKIYQRIEKLILIGPRLKQEISKSKQKKN